MIADTPKDQAAVLFSGGCGSALAAIYAGQRFKHLQLITCLTRGHVGIQGVREQVDRLGRFFGDPGKFEHRILRIDRMLRRLLHQGYLGNLRRYGFRILAHGGMARLAIRWRALVFCLDHRLDRLVDGSVAAKPGLVAGKPEWAVHQDERIQRPRLEALYREHGVLLESPLIERGSDVEDTLFRMRFQPTPSVRGSSAHRRLDDRQQLLSAAVLRRYGSPQTPKDYERLMGGLYRDKLERVAAWTRAHLKAEDGLRLAQLLEE